MRRTNTLARKNGIIKQSALFAGVGKKTPRYWRVNERSFFFSSCGLFSCFHI